MISPGPGGVCGALYAAKNRVGEGTKAFNSIENALSAVNSRLNKFGKGWMCKGIPP